MFSLITPRLKISSSQVVKNSFKYLTTIKPQKITIPLIAKKYIDQTTISLLHDYFIFKLCSCKFLSSRAQQIAKFSETIKLDSFFFWFLKKTIFKKFCGGETILEVKHIANRLSLKNIDVIIDYASELNTSYDSGENSCHLALKNILRSIDVSFNESFVAVKLSTLFSGEILKRINGYILQNMEFSDIESHYLYIAGISRLDTIVSHAKLKNLSIAIDAEQSFIQESIDFVALKMMHKYNRFGNVSYPIILNTFQMYRLDGLCRLKRFLAISQKHNLHFGAKVVRGAYIQEESEWSILTGHKNPLFKDIKNTHAQYNDSIALLFKYISKLDPADKRIFYIIFATHNKRSTQLVTEYLYNMFEKIGLCRIYIAQLYGMRDELTLALADSGYRVAKYLPFGPVKEVFPYLLRRSQENSASSSMLDSEASAIKIELKRRIGF